MKSKKRWRDYKGDVYAYLADRMRADGMHYVERTTPDNLRGLTEKKRGVILQSTNFGGCGVHAGHPYGCAFVWDTPKPDLFEIGSVWVHKGKRRNGVAPQLLSAALRLIPPGASTFVVSDSRALIDSVDELGFQIVMFALEEQLCQWARMAGFPKERKPPEGALLSNVAEAARTGRPLLRTLLVRA